MVDAKTVDRQKGACISSCRYEYDQSFLDIYLIYKVCIPIPGCRAAIALPSRSYSSLTLSSSTSTSQKRACTCSFWYSEWRKDHSADRRECKLAV
eukprot:1154913-Pelagomonas_calceolata.AAC.1